ncbi:MULTISPECIES: S49 family peptidase [unclassified Lysobacter]|uniref:S49 family peptidase n=1 Tax=unclassified Lysobacter TaxID=2635362 RepID=UPI001BE887B4|nr:MULTISPECIES: S49 family peptidase [unclassified Lysobacter]MBT2748573.1 S49 family peptidase [Lysobacter sp. ISL-42]MBT2751508.1 S49 family peptidase [Lysobacter sp. ISL-50]MBT2775702.1 S49 family peptidase [Lysobacter sp. ISL-54]MBT2782333.1 S49 family peptidase [Lysobacter sp. ISL-52]
MTPIPHLAARVFNTPLLIQRAKLEVILSVLAPRFDLQTLPPPQMAPPNTSTVPRLGDERGIYVLPIHGTLVQRAIGLDALSGLTSYQSIARRIEAALADDSVRGIVLDIDSPGGEAAGVFDLADTIRAARSIKPIWAVANDSAFSAAYALASASQRLFLTRTAGIGSIGVIALHVDQSQYDAKAGLKFTPIHAGARKNDATPHSALTDEARDSIQTEVNRLYELFVLTVADQRGLSAESVRKTEAALYFGQDAINVGLADRLGTLSDAVQQMHIELDATARPLFLESPVMSTPDSTVPTVDADAVRAQAHSDALAIAELCELAGQPQLTATLLAAGVTLAVARQRLLAAKAESREITSHLSPNAPTPSVALSAADNPLIQAVKARAATAKKER